MRIVHTALCELSTHGRPVWPDLPSGGARKWKEKGLATVKLAWSLKADRTRLDLHGVAIRLHSCVVSSHAFVNASWIRWKSSLMKSSPLMLMKLREIPQSSVQLPNVLEIILPISPPQTQEALGSCNNKTKAKKTFALSVQSKQGAPTTDRLFLWIFKNQFRIYINLHFASLMEEKHKQAEAEGRRRHREGKKETFWI